MRYENGRAPKVEPCALELLSSDITDQTAATMLNAILQPGAEIEPKTYDCGRCSAQLILHASGIVGNSLDCGRLQAKLAETQV